MANWCANMVTFECDEKKLRQIELLFHSLAAKEALTGQGLLPDFIPSTFPYFFNIYWEDNQLHFATKWSPNLDTMVEVAKHFGVDYSHFYCEPGCLLYGEATYENGELKNTVLTASDFESYQHDKENDIWTFEGKEYNDVYEVWEILLERRKQK